MQKNQQNDQENNKQKNQQNDQENKKRNKQNNQQNTQQRNQQDNQIVEALAITYLDKSDVNIQQVPVELRQPSALQGLLRFAIEATNAEYAPNTSGTGPIDEERRGVLEQVIKSLTVDIAEIVQKAVKILTDNEKIRIIQVGDPLPDEVDIAFTSLLQIIDDIDIAKDFYKMGGFTIFPIAYGSENEEIRARASTVLAEVCQNNPFCQARALECGLLHILLIMVQRERGIALSQNLYAISCVSRGYQPALQELLEQGGCVTLLQVLATAEGKAATRAAFLIRYLCNRHNDFKKQFIKLNLIQTLAKQIKYGRNETTEHLLSALLGLVEDQDPTVLRQCRDPSLGLQKTLEEHLKHPDLVGDRFREEREYCQELLSKIFVNFSQ